MSELKSPQDFTGLNSSMLDLLDRLNKPHIVHASELKISLLTKYRRLILWHTAIDDLSKVYSLLGALEYTGRLDRTQLKMVQLDGSLTDWPAVQREILDATKDSWTHSKHSRKKKVGRK